MNQQSESCFRVYEAQTQIALRDHFYQDIQKVCRKLLDPETAEEAANDIFHRILKRLKAFRAEKGSFLHWARKISWNHCLKLRSRLKAAPQRPLSLDAPYPGLENGLSDILADDRPQLLFDEGETPKKRKEERALRKTLRDLKHRDREILWLRECEQSHEEIAAALGIKKGAVRTACCRARRKIKSDLVAFPFSVSV